MSSMNSMAVTTHFLFPVSFPQSLKLEFSIVVAVAFTNRLWNGPHVLSARFVVCFSLAQSFAGKCRAVAMAQTVRCRTRSGAAA
ncbi:hypothetical protein AAFF_G00213020 [Aldrovandia affinis]|uniref:Uncharacterized protein n=1 Tax=Aldrovandia affinis TaxID=143900 RepID=A0AAD7RGL6_9TELE|nr:hypothetical protein AAFF_G00213020 [Aldrovandia affinis]